MIKKIFKPTPFKLGFLITIFFVVFSTRYYYATKTDFEQHRLLKLMQIAHQKSVDLRMTSLGYRPTYNDVAIITIDEEALQKFGRWPWPRNLIAKIIDRLSDYKVKVMGFDVVFAEKERNPTTELLETTQNTPTSVRQFLIQKSKDFDNDSILAASIGKAANKVVLGMFYDYDDDFKPYQEACVKIIGEISDEYALMDSQENTTVIQEDPDISHDISKPIHDFIVAALKKINHDTQINNNLLSKNDLKALILENQKNFCGNFLNTPESIDLIKKNWGVFQNQDASLKNIAADQWIQDWKDRSLKNPIKLADHLTMNIEEISKKSKHFGYFNAFPDDDGYIRRSLLFSRFADQAIPSLPLAMFLTAKNYQGMAKISHDLNDPYSKMVSEFKLTDGETAEDVATLPLNTDAGLPINYAGPQRMFPYMSVAQLLKDGDDATITLRKGNEIEKYSVKKSEFLKDKMILIGATAIGIFDMRVTPFEGNFPGVETHANVIENILHKQFLFTDYNEPVYMPIFIFIFGLFLSFLIARYGAVTGVLATAGSLIAIYFVDRFVLFSHGIVIVIMLPIVMILCIYIALTFFKYLTEERKKKELKSTFQKYVSPAIVNEILSHPEKVALGGRKEFMTVMFSDVRGFTTLSEKLDPEILSKFLNRYLTPMTQIIFKNGGTLDKYIGDAIMAFFGAPIANKDHALQCCQAALDMVDRLDTLNKEFEKEQLPSIEIGVGMNTGHMSVGNMGSDIVRSYTVMGDSVNLASRLEGINKTYGTKIIISESTYELIKDKFICRELDRVRVKGKLLPVRIYELLGKNKIPDHIQEGARLFALGYENYHKKDFQSALKNFVDALNKMPQDPATQLYIERCQEYIATAPAENWDGVYEFKTK